ncbi:MAG TPA: hypothetical protein VND01_00670 [Candidatus Acidoferrales bacterium]|nr:hypothetical protein [Candidatus Acidoferrales bacterium]
MSILDRKNSDKIKKHVHEIAFTSILEVASKTTLLFGRTLILFAFHTIKYVISSGPCIAILDSVETQLGNFLSGL